jgi:predicted  nucleic acid-binding Zn-ribbon protein
MKDNTVITTNILKKELNSFAIELFKYLDKRFAETNGSIESIDYKYNQLMTTLDAFLKRLDDNEINNVARDAQFSRLQRWVEQIAKQSGVKLEY